MRWGKHKRQILLFVIAILLPAVVLIGLAARVARQEAELAETRAADEQRRALDQVRWQLAARLEAIQLQEMSRRVAGRGADGSKDSAIVLVTTMDSDRLTLPWDDGAKRPTSTRQFLEYRQAGESVEFTAKDFAEAVSFYRKALSAAKTTSETCEARLLLGRVLIKKTEKQQAADVYRRMLSECGSTRDEDGIRYSLYAAERLIDENLDRKSAEEYVIEYIGSNAWPQPLEAYLIRGLLGSSAEDFSERISDIEELSALARDFAKVKAAIQSVIGTETVWFAYGNEPWLVSINPAASQSPEMVFIVSSAKVAPAGTRLAAARTNDGAWLGQGFLNLSVEWPVGRFDARRPAIPTSLYAAGMALILGVTILGGYLLLRDVNRNIRMADMRSHFVANVSHELKTPLTAIRMFADTLVLGRSKDERVQAEYLKTIANESERLSRLVDNVLEFSKIEQGKKIYRMRPTDLADVVGSAARAMEYPLAQQGFKLNVATDGNVPPVAADADALQQAILNLLSNAMKYSGDSREIDLRLSKSDRDAVIEVTDHGLGIARDDQQRIFEKFYRVRSPETECIAGTGLGLTLVEHVAHAHSGRVDVRSAIGIGTTFELHVPLPEAEAQA